MNEELKKELMGATADVDLYLDRSTGGMKVADIETLSRLASEETLQTWFIETYKLLKKLQAELA